MVNDHIASQITTAGANHADEATTPVDIVADSNCGQQQKIDESNGDGDLLGIFERGVQDPFCHDCDKEDCSMSPTHTDQCKCSSGGGVCFPVQEELNLNDEATNRNLGLNSDPFVESLTAAADANLSADGVDPLVNDDLEMTPATIADQDQGRQDLQQLVTPSWTNPFTSSEVPHQQRTVPQNTPRALQKAQTLSYMPQYHVRNNSANDRDLRSSTAGTTVGGNNNTTTTTSPNLLRRSRTNSSSLIQHLSTRKPVTSKPLRKSVSISFPSFSQNPWEAVKSHNASKSSNSNNDTVTAANSDGSVIFSQRPRFSTQSSSSSSFLTHLYGLEKYVSSDLDALSTKDYLQDTSEDLRRPSLRTKSTTRSVSFDNYNGRPIDLNDINFSSQSDLNLSNYEFTNRRKRRQSYIEKSLSNSFSQNT